jgi:hypothetical protein
VVGGQRAEGRWPALGLDPRLRAPALGPRPRGRGSQPLTRSAPRARPTARRRPAPGSRFARLASRPIRARRLSAL